MKKKFVAPVLRAESSLAHLTLGECTSCPIVVAE